MGWVGKLVGGTIGFALGGPLGAIAGAAFGHVFDKGAEGDVLEGHRLYGANDQVRLTFFVAAFSMLAKIAKADGSVSQKEIDCIEDFMARDLRLDAESRRVAVDVFHAALESPATFGDFAHQFYAGFRARPELLRLMMDILLRVAAADDGLTEKEEALLLSAVRVFGFSAEEYRRMKLKYVDDMQRHYATLGCDRTDSQETIKRQYRRRVLEYHPDTVVSKGLPEEFVRFAHDKFREIQEAYEAVKQDRNFR